MAEYCEERMCENVCLGWYAISKERKVRSRGGIEARLRRFSKVIESELFHQQPQTRSSRPMNIVLLIARPALIL